MAGHSFGQVAQVLDEFEELGADNKVFMGSDEDLFRLPVLDIWLRQQFLFVAGDQVGDFHLDVGQQDECEQGPAMLPSTECVGADAQPCQSVEYFG